MSVSQVVAGQGFSGSSKNLNFTTPPLQGDSVIALVQLSAIASVSVVDSANNAYDLINQANTGGSPVTQFMAQNVSPGTGTFTVTISVGPGAGLLSLGLLDVTGIPAGAMLWVDKATTGSFSGATALTLNEPFNNSSAVELVVALLGLLTVGQVGLTDPATGYTRAFMFNNAGQRGGSAAYKITSTVEQSSAAWSWTTSAAGTADLVTYKLLGGIFSNGVAKQSGVAGLSTTIAAVGSGRAISAARGFPGRALFATGRSVKTSTATISSGLKMVASATQRFLSAGVLTNYASVVLASPLYLGQGSILGPHAAWSAGAPVVGSTVYYDPTNMAVLSNGEVVATASDFKAEVLWLPSAGVASFLTVMVTSGFASWSQAVGVSNATLSSVSPLRSTSTAASSSALHLGAGARFATSSLQVKTGISGLTNEIRFSSTSRSRAAGSGAPKTGLALGSVAGSRAHATASMLSVISLTSHAGGIASALGAPATAVRLTSAGHATWASRSNVQFPAAFHSSPRSVSSSSLHLSTAPALRSASSSRLSVAGEVAFGARLMSHSTSRVLVDPSLSTRITPVSSSSSACSSSLLAPTLLRYGYANISVEPQLVGPQAPPGPEVTIIEQSACFVTGSWFDDNGNPYEPLSVAYRIDDTLSGDEISGWQNIPPAVSVLVTVTSAQNKMVNLTRATEEHQVMFKIVDQLGEPFYERVLYNLIAVPGVS